MSAPLISYLLLHLLLFIKFLIILCMDYPALFFYYFLSCSSFNYCFSLFSLNVLLFILTSNFHKFYILHLILFLNLNPPLRHTHPSSQTHTQTHTHLPTDTHAPSIIETVCETIGVYLDIN